MRESSVRMHRERQIPGQKTREVQSPGSFCNRAMKR
jgi:hypothetical protein